MPKASDPELRGAASTAAAASAILEAAQAEPIPGVLVGLAHKLEEAIAEHHVAGRPAKSPR